MTAGLNVDLTMLYQYMKINPSIQLYIFYLLAGMAGSVGDWGEGGNNFYDQLALRFPIFDQLASYNVIKGWSIYDQLFVNVGKKMYFVGQLT